MKSTGGLKFVAAVSALLLISVALVTKSVKVSAAAGGTITGTVRSVTR